MTMLFLLAAMLLLASCSKAGPPSTVAPEAARPSSPSPAAPAPATAPAEATIAPSPFESPAQRTPSVMSDSAYLVLTEGVVSVIQGTVDEKKGTVSLPPRGEQLGVRYSDWSVRVVRYLVEPLPYENITLHIVEYFIAADGSPVPHRTPWMVSQGEEVILFLTKKGARVHLHEDEFTIYVTTGPSVPPKVVVEDGRVRVVREGRLVIEPVDDFIARMRQYAREAGRTVP